MDATSTMHPCDNETLPVSSEGVIVASVVLTSTTSLLSIFGCFLLMFTYLAYKSLRTKGRSMLFHLSIADLIIVISHIFGLWNYIRYVNNQDGQKKSNYDSKCVTQGAFLVFGTVASLLWSNAVGIYMLVLVVNKGARAETINGIVYVVSCIVCWVIPIVLVAINAGKHYLGFHTIGSSDCYIINIKGSDIPKSEYQLAELFSYEIWVYITFLFLPILYFITFCYTRCRLIKNGTVSTKHKGSTLELKLLLVPVVFILLRIWSAILGVFAYFIDHRGYQCADAAVAVHLLDSIGINAQGFANGILFCILTQSVRKKLKKSLKKMIEKIMSCISCRRHEEIINEDLLLSTSVSEGGLQESTSSKKLPIN